MATRQNLVRLSFYVKRKNGITAEEFQKHWSAHHAEVVADCLAKYGIVKYTQFHTAPASKADAEGVLPALHTMKSLDFDGCGDFLMADFSCFRKFVDSDYNLSEIIPDEGKFIDWESAHYRVGWEEVYVENGKPVNLPYAGGPFSL